LVVAPVVTVGLSATPAAVAHAGQRRSNKTDGAKQVLLHRDIPTCIIGGKEWARWWPAGIGHKHVHRAEHRLARGNRSGWASGVGHVHDNALSTAAHGANRGNRTIHALRTARRNSDRRALARQGLGRCATDSPATASHKRNAPVETKFHSRSQPPVGTSVGRRARMTP
jgi:hypothetical protein